MSRYLVAVSLAEAETLRYLILHCLCICDLTFRFVLFFLFLFFSALTNLLSRRLVHLQHHHLQKEEDARQSNSSDTSTQPLVAKKVAVSLQVVDGNVLDSSPIFPNEGSVPKTGSVSEIGLQCLKFYNCEMYYTDEQLDWLEEGLKTASLPDRLLFFQESLRFAFLTI